MPRRVECVIEGEIVRGSVRERERSREIAAPVVPVVLSDPVVVGGGRP